MWYQITAEAQTKASRERLYSNRMELTAPRCEEGAHVLSNWLHFFSGPLLTCSSPDTDNKSPKPFSVPHCIPATVSNSFPPKPEPFLSSHGFRTPLWGPPADDSIWQLWSHREGAQFAPKQRNIISAKAISTLSETSQSHPPFECKGLAHSSAERGRERKGKAKEKAWGGQRGTQ